MFQIGNIINDSHKLLKTIKSIENKDSKPLLIVGISKVLSIFPDTILKSTEIEKDSLYYSYSEEESDEYDNFMEDFIEVCFINLFKKYEVRKEYLSLEDIVLLKVAFYYENNNIITLTSGKYIYYIDKKIYNFFYDKEIDFDTIKKFFKNTYFYSWSEEFFFQSFLKTSNCYLNLKEFTDMYNLKKEREIYIGAISLEWVKELRKTTDIDTINIWNRAYSIERYLSTIKIKIDKDKVLEVKEDLVNAELRQLLKKEHISQEYNGTDKTTGRIYCTSSSFNIQTLAEKYRDLVIPEVGCVLYDYDYSYFEYVLLNQICNLPLTEDPHLKLSMDLFKSEEHRHIAKEINYGILYGQSFSNTIEGIKKKFPNLKINFEILEGKLSQIVKPYVNLSNSLKKEYETTKCLKNYFGRNIYPQKDFALLNNYIQSTAAEFLIIKIEKINLFLKEYDPINTILLQKHDELLFNFSTKTIKDKNFLPQVQRILEEKEKNLFAKVKVKSGDNWKILS